ncbi:MAG: hypothetical protein V1862_10930 [Methanobacteriota archaeon]
MSVISCQESSDWLIGSRRDLIIPVYSIPKTSTIISQEENIPQHYKLIRVASESNHTVSIHNISFSENQTTVSRAKKQDEAEGRIESIIGAVIREKTIASPVNKTLLKQYLLQKFQTIGFEKFQQLSNDIIKKRIEKVVALELLKNLFSDINDEEFDLIKTHAKSEGFFR